MPQSRCSWREVTLGWWPSLSSVKLLEGLTTHLTAAQPCAMVEAGIVDPFYEQEKLMPWRPSPSAGP